MPTEIKKNMLKVNETANGYDIAELLQGESGIFEATAPNGERFQVISRSGHSITNFRPVREQNQQSSQNYTWHVRKVGDLRSEQDIR